MPAFLRTQYERLGPRYPLMALLGSLPGGAMTGLLATAGTALYVNMSAGEFVRLVLASWLLIWTSDAIVQARFLRRRTRLISTWIEGEREPQESVEAWNAASGIPVALLRHRPLYAAVLPGLLGWGIFAVWELDLDGVSVPIFFLASSLVYLYWLSLRFLAMELVMRPVLEDIGRALPSGTTLRPLRVSLRTRLLAALPAVNLITGVAVGGFTAGRSDDLDALGLALLGSAAVALLVSSWLVGLLSTTITAPIVQLRDATRRVQSGDLSVRVPVASTDESGELAHAFNEMVAGLEQRERLREAFGTFVDPQLTERILAEGTDLAGEETDVSLLFMDIRGFTTYAEHAEAREVVARLNDLYGSVVPLILRHGGHANKFIGDGLLAVFGAPTRLPNHADAAVGAGIEIARVVRRRYGGDLRVGIGVNSGRVVVGTVGGGGRLDFTVIGDAVNTAARVESHTRETGDDLLVTDATRGALSHDFGGWVERGSATLKGRQAQVALLAPLVLVDRS